MGFFRRGQAQRFPAGPRLAVKREAGGGGRVREAAGTGHRRRRRTWLLRSFRTRSASSPDVANDVFPSDSAGPIGEQCVDIIGEWAETEARFWPDADRARRADARPMPRYFSILVYPDRVIGDPRGTVLPSDEVAVGTALTIMDDLLDIAGPRQPRPIIMVRNEAGEIVYQFPSN